MEQPLRRTGPRPLPLHLAIATSTWIGSAAALTQLSGVSSGSKGASPPNKGVPVASLPWHRELSARAKALESDLAAVDRRAFTAAVGREIRRRLDEFEIGLRRYRAHPARRPSETPPIIWRDGTTRLLDYSRGGGGLPLLVVPSATTARIQEMHIAVGQMLCGALERRLGFV